MINDLLPISVTFELIQIERFKKELYKLLLMEEEKLRQEIESFKKYLVLNYSLREITINEHLGNIKRMMKKMDNLNPDKEEVTDYVYELRQSNKSPSHMCNNIQSIEKFMDFKKKLVRFAKPKRQKVLLMEILTEAEINRMIQSTKDIKQKAMICVLSYSGIRNRSFCHLKVKDVDFGNNQIRITKVKGKKEYLPYISSECINILLKYLKEYPRKNEDYLFTTKIRNNQYQTSDIRKFVKVLAIRSEIEKRVYVHLLRHSLASNMLNRGANIITIKNQLGHDYIASTEQYLSLFPERNKSEYEIYKPSYL